MTSLLKITIAFLGLPVGLILILFGANALFVNHSGLETDSETMYVIIFGLVMFIGGIGIAFYSSLFLAVGDTS